ncbi:hypothetical protein E4U16_003331 [Claviceps sp. LM84 group G4]|nr:hypothetical protein E4U16_003331 [Claviceps sp. LM84 group G4]
MIGRLMFHQLVSLENTENIKTKVNPCPRFSLSLSLTHTHTHTYTHTYTHLFSHRANNSQQLFFSQPSKNEAHLSRASHLLCRHRYSSHASCH